MKYRIVKDVGNSTSKPKYITLMLKEEKYSKGYLEKKKKIDEIQDSSTLGNQEAQ